MARVKRLGLLLVLTTVGINLTAKGQVAIRTDGKDVSESQILIQQANGLAHAKRWDDAVKLYLQALRLSGGFSPDGCVIHASSAPRGRLDAAGDEGEDRKSCRQQVGGTARLRATIPVEAAE
jgi:hypothetical protein